MKIVREWLETIAWRTDDELEDDPNYKTEMWVNDSPNFNSYILDKNLCAKEWLRFDTCFDAPDYGTWVNLHDRQMLIYLEGVITLETFINRDAFKQELEALYQSCKPSYVMYRCINGIGKRVVVFEAIT